MKIIDNPTIGIGLLICVSLAVLGFTFLTTAEGQFPVADMVTSDEGTLGVSSVHSPDDTDESPFLDRASTNQGWPALAQSAAPQPRQQSFNTVLIESERSNRAGFELKQHDDPFAAPPHEQLRRQQPDQPKLPPISADRIVRDPMAQGILATRQKPSQIEKRDEFLFRIVELRLRRGEFEKLAPVVLQMHNPEKAIEAMLDFAEKSADDESITQLLDMATAATMQMGQPRPPVSGMMGMSSGMGGSIMPPGQPMPGAVGGMPGGMGVPGIPGGTNGPIMPPGMAPGALLWDGIMPRQQAR